MPWTAGQLQEEKHHQTRRMGGWAGLVSTLWCFCIRAIRSRCQSGISGHSNGATNPSRAENKAVGSGSGVIRPAQTSAITTPNSPPDARDRLPDLFTRSM